VYSGADGPDFEIYTIKAGSDGQQPVTTNKTVDTFPDWAARR